MKYVKLPEQITEAVELMLIILAAPSEKQMDLIKMRKRIKIMDELEKQKAAKTITLEDEHYNEIVGVFETYGYKAASRDVLKVYDALKAAKDEPEVNEQALPEGPK